MAPPSGAHVPRGPHGIARARAVPQGTGRHETAAQRDECVRYDEIKCVHKQTFTPPNMYMCMGTLYMGTQAALHTCPIFEVPQLM